MEISSWQQELRETVRDPLRLLTELQIPVEDLPFSQNSLDSFPLRVPVDYIKRIQKRDTADPLLLQVFPQAREDLVQPGYSHDAVGDINTQTVPGVLHKYYGRVLLITTGACAIHCRYCFRRHFPYNEAHASRHNWGPALEYISSNASIAEVILSGGDPLTLTDDKLQDLIARLERIPHLQRLRVHTRMPVVLASRITDALLLSLSKTSLRTLIVIHSNHPHELSPAVLAGLQKIKDAGIISLNQTVLLKGVNDSADTLGQLNEQLFDYGVLPYYLHLLDRVQGAAHFTVSDNSATGIMKKLRTKLPGYLVPRLVREIAGQPYKIPLL